MNELTMTVTGWVATEPKLHIGASGTRMLTFRLATTVRYFDRNKNEWADQPTTWFTVRVFRAAALLVQDSLRKGQPVVVAGRFRINEWESNSGPRSDLVLDATTVGHDLTRGVASFRRAVVDGGDVTYPDPARAEAAPEDDSEESEPIDVSNLPEIDDEAVEQEEPELEGAGVR